MWWLVSTSELSVLRLIQLFVPFFPSARQHTSRQRDVASDLCGAVGTCRIQQTVFRHHPTGPEDHVHFDRTQLWSVPSEKVSAGFVDDTEDLDKS